MPSPIPGPKASSGVAPCLREGIFFLTLLHHQIHMELIDTVNMMFDFFGEKKTAAVMMVSKRK